MGPSSSRPPPIVTIRRERTWHLPGSYRRRPYCERNLETIYITHAHFDHFYGLSILLDRFPSARAIATPKTVNAMQMSFTPPVERLARRLFPGQMAAKFVAPEPYEHNTFTLEGQELRIIEQGHTDSADTTSLYVPSIGLVVAGDVVYNQCHMYVGDTTPESRKNWVAAFNTMFTSTLARITNSSVACNQSTTCSGEVATYSLTLTGLTAPTPVMGTLDGMLSGIGTASGTVSVAVNGIPVSLAPFSVDVGPFFKTLFSTQIPTTFGNTVALTGSLNLTLPPGDSIALPTSLDFTIAQVPEPASVSLIGCGLLGLASLARLWGFRRS